MTRNIDMAAVPNYENLIEMLRDRFGQNLRWVASFDSKTYNYTVEYIRPDLKTELSNHQFDVVVHRSIALFRRPYIEEVYTHLGNVNALVLQHDRATAVHLYLSDTTGVIVKIKAGNSVSIPEFTNDCIAALYPEEQKQ
ncbi:MULTISPECIES: hypothetical protein [Haloferax]|uniref:Uncharacterized protein n=1 Tax=Haloferax marinum TaxID=2666143 RepID=A0A6A8G8L9_9EURY|nr:MULTISPECIES: hypothetical protein [Haloferax]KAB1197850.1 hypothetical protein Hfx1150_10090 [Haloferax sp. CBA1150]MRW96912.1 hypothetical protein [Haloferax marinum]